MLESVHGLQDLSPHVCVGDSHAVRWMQEVPVVVSCVDQEPEQDGIMVGTVVGEVMRAAIRTIVGESGETGEIVRSFRS